MHSVAGGVVGGGFLCAEMLDFKSIQGLHLLESHSHHQHSL